MKSSCDWKHTFNAEEQACVRQQDPGEVGPRPGGVVSTPAAEDYVAEAGGET